MQDDSGNVAEVPVVPNHEEMSSENKVYPAEQKAFKPDTEIDSHKEPEKGPRVYPNLALEPINAAEDGRAPGQGDLSSPATLNQIVYEQQGQEEIPAKVPLDNKNLMSPVLEEPRPEPNERVDQNPPTPSNWERSARLVLIKCINDFQQIRACAKFDPLRKVMDDLKPSLQTDNEYDKTLLIDFFQHAFEIAQDDVLNIALNTVSKLASFAYFPADKKVSASNPSSKSMLQCIVDMVCDCINDEVVDGTLQLNVVKALSAFILCPNKNDLLHGAILLNSIRKLYNIFLLGDDDSIQSVAQASLTQAVGIVFERLRMFHPSKPSTNSRFNDIATASTDSLHENVSNAEEKITLQSMASNGTSKLDYVKMDVENSKTTSLEHLSLQDAYLVFRTLCRLAVRHSSSEKVDNIRSQAMRSKLISLHLIYFILDKNGDLFTELTFPFQNIPALEGLTLVQASRQYICLVLSRNAVSPIPQVFEICCDIFWLIVSTLRIHFKQEIAVFFHEVYFPILDLKNTSYNQKLHTLLIFQRICRNPRALVELYINYDCDRNSTTNVFEQLLFSISKTNSITPLDPNTYQYEDLLPSMETSNRSATPFLTTNSSSLNSEVVQLTNFSDYQLKLKALECVIDVLHSLMSWAESGFYLARGNISADENTTGADDDSLARSDTPNTLPLHSGRPSVETNSCSSSSLALADPSEFELNKQRKNLLRHCINKFNYKPLLGIKHLSENGFVNTDDPASLATFLFNTEGFDKTTLGDYLGAGEEYNISVMHNFIDCFNFANYRFVDALRRLLQAFRLPGEAQKIDRIMLKFSERYMKENPSAFANADTAYILAYSIIMLNTDLHSPQIKNKMSKEDFVKNNRGINSGGDLDEDYLGFVYEDILNNEIVLKDEQQLAAIAPLMTSNNNVGLFAASFTQTGRDLQRTAYLQASEEMANKTTTVLKKLMKQQKHNPKKENVFYNAKHFEHIGPMLEAGWMPILAAISNPLQESEYLYELSWCLEGFQYVIHIACLFGLDLVRDAFIKTLVNFTNLHSAYDIKTKNTMVIKTLLKIACTEGNDLRSSWKDILTSISQLERVQLIGEGVDETEIPDVINARVRPSNSMKTRQMSGTLQNQTPRSTSKQLSFDVISELMSTETILSIDKIFTQTSSLSGVAIKSFFEALCEVAWDEITSSSDSENPRLFSLQKLVEISYYNMGRIRVEWSSIWNVLGKFFNLVASHRNKRVAVFALDSLRQLSMHFLQIEELSLFSFQKEFLKPYEYVMSSDASVDVKELVLQCIRQMIQARVSSIKSGWKTLFGVFTFSAKARDDTLLLLTFETLLDIFEHHYNFIVQQSCLIDMVVSFTELCKNGVNQKISLQSLDVIKKIYSKLVLEAKSKKNTNEEEVPKSAFPILFAYYDVVVSAEDLEVRSRALQNMFYIFLEESDEFTEQIWEIVSRKFIFPIFSTFSLDSDDILLRDEEVRTWQSTTLVEALKGIVALISRRLEKLHTLLKGYFRLFSTCICRDNVSLSRIGTSCMQQVLLENAHRFTKGDWDLVVELFVELFRETTPHKLLLEEAFWFDDENFIRFNSAHSQATRTEVDKSSVNLIAEKQNEFRSMIRKCILQLLLVSIVAELLDYENIFKYIPQHQVLKLTQAVYDSWQFARKFNENKSLRVSLLNIGYMKQLPNLLRQETASALLYITLLFRLLNSESLPVDSSSCTEVTNLLFPACAGLLELYASMTIEKHTRNHASWQPVIVTILDNTLKLPESLFIGSMRQLYYSCCSMIAKGSLDDQLRGLLKAYFNRVGRTFLEKEPKEPKD
ncbi:Sec7 domain-containing protein [Schizosaccharomyces cryophilus OY26]|uniref:Sec7 domain-containing protein n=1 Tax=Schizosaccharomyces cryophilus (strain OY26 / ATCC MYA-4695 / CBS 11777 / NBRC 106824 / NRRL Y48691) TaxID=653667 RepID=S9W0J8_SCHCR|nr:Sec7 domain-containing protein [Schizosaccharomyces cryophilus OY26]EPY51939.1 Sec7 domain-containing protein [Schizosaccharomyces cryophilus OY26]